MSETGGESTIKAVSLFSGLGGLDIGLHQAGVETVVCVERDETAANTLKINSTKHDRKPEGEYISVRMRYPWNVVNRDIRNLEVDDILDAAGATRDEIDLVVGGPPCQTFSRSNEGHRSGTDTERGRLYQEFARVIHKIEPAGFIFENVRGLRSANEGKDLEVIIDAFEDDTYTTDHKVLNAADYGVPQTRERIFILGARNERKPSFPDQTHSEKGSDGTKEWVKAGAALEEFDIDEVIEEKGGYRNAIGSKYGPLLRDIPEGANYQHFSERKYDPEREEFVERDEQELDEKRFDWRSRHWNYLLKMDRGRPSWTIQADPGTTVGPFHWRARKLSLLEQMKLMDLPLDYYIAGTPGEIQEQIGNAVPPRFAEVVAKELVTSLGQNPESSTSKTHERHIDTRRVEEGPLTIDINTEESPWTSADRILRTILSEEAVVVKAHQQAIPYAIDALEITRRHARRNLKVDVHEKTVEDEQAEGGVASELEAKVVTTEAAVKTTSSSTAS